MPFVERDSQTNAVVGIYTCAQPAAAEEVLPDDNVEVVAFRARFAQAAPRDTFAELDALRSALIGKKLVSSADIESAATALGQVSELGAD